MSDDAPRLLAHVSTPMDDVGREADVAEPVPWRDGTGAFVDVEVEIGAPTPLAVTLGADEARALGFELIQAAGRSEQLVADHVDARERPDRDDPPVQERAGD